MRFVFDLVEKLAIRTSVPIGGIWLILLSFGGALWLILEYPFYTQRDLIIGFAVWAVAYIGLWISYRDEFWMSTKLIEILRRGARGELESPDDQD